MKPFTKNLRLLALLGVLAATLGLLRAETATATGQEAAATSTTQSNPETTKPETAPTDDKAASPELRSLTPEAPAEAEKSDMDKAEAPSSPEPAAPESQAAVEPAKPAESSEAAPAEPAAEPAKPAAPASDEKPATKSKHRKPLKVRANVNAEVPFGDVLIKEGETANEAVSVAGSTTVKGEVRSDAVAVFGNNTIGTKARVGKDAVAVFGNLDIDGEVQHQAVAVFGNMRLGPNAKVNGETVIVFGTLDKDPAAQASNVKMVMALPGMGYFGSMSAWFHECLLKGRLLAFSGNVTWAWCIAGAHLILYVLISLLFRKGTQRSVENLENRPGMSLLSALLVFLLTPLVIIILAIGTITAILIPILIISLFFLGFFGRTVMLAWFGRLVTRFLPAERSASITLSVLVGGVLIALLYCIPLLGILLHSLIGSIGLGAAVLTITDSMKREPKPPTAAKATTRAAVPAAIPAPKPAAEGSSLAASIQVPPVVIAPVVEARVAPAATSIDSPARASTTVEASATAVAPEAAPAPVSVPEPVAGGPIIPAAPTFSPPPAAPTAARAPEAASLDTLPRAGFWLRMGAMGIDFILVILSLALLSSITPDWAHVRFGPWVFLLLAAYAAALWKHRGTTIGGIICRIQVVRTDGQAIDWTTAVIRGLGCILSAFAAGLGFIWIAIDRDQESWHDKIAGTAVVRVPKSRPLV